MFYMNFRYLFSLLLSLLCSSLDFDKDTGYFVKQTQNVFLNIDDAAFTCLFDFDRKIQWDKSKLIPGQQQTVSVNGCRKISLKFKILKQVRLSVFGCWYMPSNLYILDLYNKLVFKKIGIDFEYQSMPDDTIWDIFQETITVFYGCKITFTIMFVYTSKKMSDLELNTLISDVPRDSYRPYRSI